jgi:hypothetical protein
MDTQPRTANRSDPRNLDFEAMHCLTSLSKPIRARDLSGSLQRLTNVAEAARFILSNFSVERARDVDWKYAAAALETATGNAALNDIATSAVRNLLDADRLLESDADL